MRGGRGGGQGRGVEEGAEEGEEEGEKEDPGPFPPPSRRQLGVRGPGVAVGRLRGAGPAAGLSPGCGDGGGGRQRRQLPPLSSGPLRSAPWCVDSSPSCCLMESRRSRHRKCLYCPPHSLPVAGMEPIGGLSPGTCAGGRPGNEGREARGLAGADPDPDPTRPDATRSPGPASPRRPGGAASVRTPAQHLLLPSCCLLSHCPVEAAVTKLKQLPPKHAS